MNEHIVEMIKIVGIKLRMVIDEIEDERVISRFAEGDKEDCNKCIDIAISLSTDEVKKRFYPELERGMVKSIIKSAMNTSSMDVLKNIIQETANDILEIGEFGE